MIAFAESDDAVHESVELGKSSLFHIALHTRLESRLERIDEGNARCHEILLEDNPHRLAERLDLTDQAEIRVAHRAFLLKRLARRIVIKPCRAHRRDKAELRQRIAADVEAVVSANVGILQELFERLRLRLQAFILIGTEAEDHAQDLLRLLQYARRLETAEDVDAAVEHGQPRQILLHDLARAEDVQDRDDERIGACCTLRERDGVGKRVVLAADEEHIGRFIVSLRRLRLHVLDMERASVRRLDRQTVLLKSLQVPAACNQRHIVPREREIAAEHPARAARAEHRKFHCKCLPPYSRNLPANSFDYIINHPRENQEYSHCGFR